MTAIIRRARRAQRVVLNADAYLQGRGLRFGQGGNARGAVMMMQMRTTRIAGAALGRVRKDAQYELLGHAMGGHETPGGNGAVAEIVGDPLLNNESHTGVVSGLLVHGASLVDMISLPKAERDGCYEREQQRGVGAPVEKATIDGFFDDTQ